MNLKKNVNSISGRAQFFIFTKGPKILWAGPVGRILVNKENIPKAIDETLTLESIFKVAELAGHCTARKPYQRPDMGHAVNVLGPLVEQWKPANHEDEEAYGI
ncbi:hypothetical protein ACOSP7_006381 [Xanthoceras sorbifolium]